MVVRCLCRYGVSGQAVTRFHSDPGASIQPSSLDHGLATGQRACSQSRVWLQRVRRLPIRSSHLNALPTVGRPPLRFFAAGLALVLAGCAVPPPAGGDKAGRPLRQPLHRPVPIEGSAISPACGKPLPLNEKSESTTRTAALIAEALRQHRAFGSQIIDVEGGLIHAGFAEAEFDRLPGASLSTWERVDAFWSAVPAHDADARRIRISKGASVSLRFALQETGVGDSSDAGPAISGVPMEPGSDVRAAVRTSLRRAAAVDNPWSAAFISYLQSQAGARPDEFAFSAAHVDYVEQAVEVSMEEANAASPAGIYRACDLAVAAPLPGDLLCATRGARAAVGSYAELVASLSDRWLANSAFPMHCELVVAVDPAGRFLESIGGNVVQSVTRRRLALADDGTGLLHRRYAAAAALAIAASAASTAAAHCNGVAEVEAGAAPDPEKDLESKAAAQADAATSCRSPSLNDAPWVVLLQLRR